MRMYIEKALLEATSARLERLSQYPDASEHNTSSDYLRGLIALSGLSQRGVARKLGISERMMRYYLACSVDEYRSAPYLVQYGIEQLARASCKS